MNPIWILKNQFQTQKKQVADLPMTNNLWWFGRSVKCPNLWCCHICYHEVDKKLLIILRDGRKLVGWLRSIPDTLEIRLNLIDECIRMCPRMSMDWWMVDGIMWCETSKDFWSICQSSCGAHRRAAHPLRGNPQIEESFEILRYFEIIL